jgi:glutathione S-transferase
MSRPRLELWQTEWCPASHRVRQRLTELGLTYVAHQVPVERDDRAQLEVATGQRSIPVLVAGGEIVEGEQAIRSYLDGHFTEPYGAERQRAKAAKAKQKELEEACPRLTAAPTP